MDDTSSNLAGVKIYTDGACRGNPGPGGFGVVLLSGARRKELSAGFRRTTNNRMELMAAICGLEALRRPCSVTIWSDSRYLIDAMTKGWVHGWKRKGWSRGPGKPLRNRDLWMRLETARAPHRVTWKWVKGHAGHAFNERCDTLAVQAATSTELAVDEGFQAGEGETLL